MNKNKKQKSNKKNTDIKGQSKLTKFFTNKTGSLDEAPVAAPLKDVINKKISPKYPKLDRGTEQEVIILSDSDEEKEELKVLELPVATACAEDIPPPCSTTAQSVTPTNDVCDTGFGESDSGDEVLSQINIEQVISSQEKLTQQIQQKVINMTPSKSPRSKANYFSPLSRLNSSSKGKSPSFKITPPNNSSKNEISGSPVKHPIVKDLFSEFSEPFVPNYLKNFESVFNTAISDPFNAHLFDDFDKIIAQKFRGLSLEGRCLYVRLFQRKWEWKLASTIKYPLIREELGPVFSELHKSGFLVEIKDVQDKLELESILDVLNAEQMIILGKKMNVTTQNKSKTKGSIKEALLALGKKKPQNSFGSTTNPSSIIKKRALETLEGGTYMLEGARKALFSRLFILHSPPQYWEDEQVQATNQLLKIWMAYDGRMTYPQCKINKTTVIYSDRQDLLRFHDAWTLHCDITAQTESKNWEEVIELGRKATDTLKKILSDNEIIDMDRNLPTFLRVYKAGSVILRVSRLGVEGLQKLKRYEEANDIIKILLAQDIYLPHYRGHFYERLSINQKQLKVAHEERRQLLESAIKDIFLQDSHKLNLSERLEKVLEDIKKRTKPPRKRAKKSIEEDGSIVVDEVENDITGPSDLFRLSTETPCRFIEGEKLFNPNSGKSVFLSKENDYGTSQTSSVENFAISYYDSLGFEHGIHAEGALISTLFGLLFWDEIYSDEISDCFHSEYQTMPLDLCFEDFYKRRESLLCDKLNGMRSSWDITSALKILEDNWNAHYDVLSIVNWKLFSSVTHAQSLLTTMGLHVCAAICERLARNYRHFRSGFPDLIVWNKTDFIFVEVKGPGDSLSHKQKIWLDFLLSIPAQAEVCHVKAVSNKRIQV